MNAYNIKSIELCFFHFEQVNDICFQVNTLKLQFLANHRIVCCISPAKSAKSNFKIHVGINPNEYDQFTLNVIWSKLCWLTETFTKRWLEREWALQRTTFSILYQFLRSFLFILNRSDDKQMRACTMFFVQ